MEDALGVYEAKEARFGAAAMRELERWVLLRTIDSKWRDHLYEMDYLREGIGLRALAQRDPLVEYKNEGFNMFQEMMDSIQRISSATSIHLEVVQEEPAAAPAAPAKQLAYSGGGDSGLAQNFAGTAAAARTVQRSPTARARPTRPLSRPPAPWSRRGSVADKVGRNDLCPCGSGKKYKKCCGPERRPAIPPRLRSLRYDASGTAQRSASVAGARPRRTGAARWSPYTEVGPAMVFQRSLAQRSELSDGGTPSPHGLYLPA